MTGIENPAKGGRYITFEFVMDGKRYRSGCGLYDKLEYNYRHGRFDIWVALEKAHPNNNRVLVDSGDFEQFEVNEKDTAGIACNYY
ncbi:MAG: hypothetical protein JO301_13360 [Chitinophagaceae bacterium]|nr:hypothetical protein [Chitinophagaceae bacterium]